MCNVAAAWYFGFNVYGCCDLGMGFWVIVVLLGCFWWVELVLVYLCMIVYNCLGVVCVCVFGFFAYYGFVKIALLT